MKGKPNELWKLKVQVPLLCGFFIGGVCGCIAHARVGKHAMFFSVGIFGVIWMLYVLVVAHARQEGLYMALFNGEDNPFRINTCIGDHSSGQRRIHIDSNIPMVSDVVDCDGVVDTEWNSTAQLSSVERNKEDTINEDPYPL